jgi:hypothetical protein
MHVTVNFRIFLFLSIFFEPFSFEWIFIQEFFLFFFNRGFRKRLIMNEFFLNYGK